MSESKYREWILDTIDSLRSRKARPDLERICRMVRRRHGSEPDRTCAELEKLIQEQTVLKVNYKGSISYRNAAKVQRRSRKKDDVSLAAAARRSAMEEASHSDLSNGDSALGAVDQDEEDLEGDTSMAMDTDSNPDEEGAEESHDGPVRPSPSPTHEDASLQCASIRAVSAPCSPSAPQPGSGPICSSVSAPDCAATQKAGERPNSLPPSSPRALTHNEWAYDSAVCPVEPQHPGMQRDKVELNPVDLSETPSPCVSSNGKKDSESREEESSLSSDQLVPDSAAQPEEVRKDSDGRLQAVSSSPDNSTLKKIDTPYSAAEGALLNGGTCDQVSVKVEKINQNLLQWTVADVASYFSAAGFPEQAVAFRTQEIDGKSLLLMQRSDVLTGLSIRLGPALKIYERHIKVLQRTHFLECDDI
ncbi:sterile alpha motif domain containing 1a isoform X1 [Cyprinodon tularosa]|uniref:sterile alpha motif domain containing 1a isoform X1 n=1 Tax=Cyprinodon tularosa TaxID=77115 RepID=UPI0018E23B26|nr:sterile alpha motif domain containing 1a isoform X1 [Cyprinodon tularosa]